MCTSKGLKPSSLAVFLPIGHKHVSLSGCRGYKIQDISCGGVYWPEYLIFGLGFSFVALCMAHAFQKAGQIFEKYSTLSSRLVRVFRVAGLVGCFSMIPMAWISMKMHRGRPPKREQEAKLHEHHLKVLLRCSETIRSVAPSKQLRTHLMFAGLTMGPWLVAFSVRCYSGCPPYHKVAVFTCIGAGAAWIEGF